MADEPARAVKVEVESRSSMAYSGLRTQDPGRLASWVGGSSVLACVRRASGRPFQRHGLWVYWVAKAWRNLCVCPGPGPWAGTQQK